MSGGSAEEIDKDRRLLYGAMTRAKRHLHLIHPIRFYRSQQQKLEDVHMFGPLSWFISDSTSINSSDGSGLNQLLPSLCPYQEVGVLMWLRGCGTCGAS